MCIRDSLLPKWRGAAPMLRSIMNLDNETGITIMKIVEELDTTDSIRCFFAILFLARDEKIDILQEEGEDEIRVTLIKQ